MDQQVAIEFTMEEVSGLSFMFEQIFENFSEETYGDILAKASENRINTLAEME